mgnify:CR=1 FL=1
MLFRSGTPAGLLPLQAESFFCGVSPHTNRAIARMFAPSTTVAVVLKMNPLLLFHAIARPPAKSHHCSYRLHTYLNEIPGSSYGDDPFIRCGAFRTLTKVRGLRLIENIANNLIASLNYYSVKQWQIHLMSLANQRSDQKRQCYNDKHDQFACL